MRKLPPLNALRAFEAAARHMSFSKAARELEVTHGAISKQIAALEEWLGTAVFARPRAPLSLTGAGRTLLAAATPALDRISVAASYLQEHKETRALSVNAPATILIRWLIPRLSNFHRREPGVEVKLTTSAGPPNFETDHVVIRGGFRQPEAQVAVPFMTETIVPVCHPDLLEGGHLQGPGDLRHQTFLSYRNEPLPWAEWLALAQQPQLRPAQLLQFEQMYLAIQAAAEGLGVVLAPLSMVADDVITGKLCTPFGVELARKRQYFALIAPQWHGDPVVETFKQWLLKEGEDTERSLAQLLQTLARPA
ncbi:MULTISPECIES: LysR substrate-binding domain-containing protein [Ramlibacter]|uniref:LysR family transcriptional regulator n=1 Tax=Ramlibacter pinisoli TaxID=2682844 RepID=A0A6N8IZ56_9BURK|nr:MULTISPECIES: LysR substrate-binding domain-containing protein [Ramlibacter]MBA2962332.1 LysR family transcriptional regulator [Ramlibacter sp. CGMCC 1.13660]MVQ32274.1 LysR family transcriptional regulator [Ramlibacter pinisoli]